MTTNVAFVSDIVDRASLRGYLGRVPLLCALLMVTEGIDTFGVGFVGPFLAAHYDISTQQLAAVYTATVVASLVGAVVIAPLSDRFGRRPFLIGSGLVMAPCTALTAWANSIEALLILRFLIGIAFGVALPVAISLTADYAPRRRKAFLLMLMNTGINGGMILAGLGAAAIVPAFGWQSLLYASAVLSGAVALAAIFLLPESIQILAGKAPDHPRTIAAAVRIVPDLELAKGLRLEPDGRQGASGSPLALLREGKWLFTALLWLLMSFCYVMINFVAYWLPTAIMNAGGTVADAGLLVSIGKSGGVALAFALSLLADRVGLPRILALSLGVASLATLLVGLTAAVPAVAAAFVIIVCTTMNSNTSGTQALIAAAYPANLRGTATGWISGLARLVGGGAGTLAGGAMIAAGWRENRIAPALAVVLALACLVVVALVRLNSPPPASQQPSPAVP